MGGSGQWKHSRDNVEEVLEQEMGAQVGRYPWSPGGRLPLESRWEAMGSAGEWRPVRLGCV